MEMGSGKAALALYAPSRTKAIEPPNRSAVKHCLYQAADLGNATAEYILGRDLLNKNPDKAKAYLQSSAKKDNAQSMYLLANSCWMKEKQPKPCGIWKHQRIVIGDVRRGLDCCTTTN